MQYVLLFVVLVVGSVSVFAAGFVINKNDTILYSTSGSEQSNTNNNNNNYAVDWVAYRICAKEAGISSFQSFAFETLHASDICLVVPPWTSDRSCLFLAFGI